MTASADHRIVSRALVAAGIVLSAVPAAASCIAAARLAELYAAYDDLIEGHGTPRADIGRFVIEDDFGATARDRILGDLSSGGSHDEFQGIGSVLAAVEDLSAPGASDADLDAHRRNRAALAASLRATGCFESPSAPVERGAPAAAEDPDPENPVDPASPDAVGPLRAMKALGAVITANSPYSILVGATGLFCSVWTGRMIRRRIIVARSRAYPRLAFEADLPVAFAGTGTRPMHVVNISRGGLLVRRPDDGTQVRAGTHAAVRLDGRMVPSSVVWDNEHFLGMSFHEPLDGDFLNALIDARAAPETKTAPEPGAA